MRYVPWTILLLLLAGLPASAQIGPPQPRAERHGYSLGIGLHNVQSRWMPYDYDVDRNRIYFEGSYGFTDSVEAFGRVGVSDWVINDIESYRPGVTRDVSSDGYPAFLSGGLPGQGVAIRQGVVNRWFSRGCVVFRLGKERPLGLQRLPRALVRSDGGDQCRSVGWV